MAIIPKINTLNEIMDNKTYKMEYRDYLGYSGLGEECERKIWYGFRWAYDKEHSARVNRIFDRGKMEEYRIQSSLVEKGCTILNVEKEVEGVTGHVRGHIDGIVYNVPTAEKTEHLLEIKTMKNSSFQKYMKDGLKNYSKTYWQQIHSYMGHLNISRCLYVVTNKDTEERDYKRIKFDRDSFTEGERKALRIITSPNSPDRLIGANRTFFKCKFCDARKQCLYDEPLKVTCRTC